MIHATAATVIGPSHEAQGGPNQDALRLRGSQGGWFLAVADGLGSRPLSHVGSRLAVRVAEKCLRRGLFERSPREAIQDFYRAWLTALPSNDPSSMATTILAASVREDGRCSIVQLGDGFVLYRAGGDFGVLTGDRAGFANETAALGVTRSFGAWQHTSFVLSQPRDGVMLMTDGLADDLVPERLDGFFDRLIGVAAKRSRRNGKRWLARQLRAWPTPLHADDKTVGLIFRADR